MDPLTIIFLSALGGCVFMVGFNFGRLSQDKVIESTITYLIASGYLKGRQDADGEWEILKVDEN